MKTTLANENNCIKIHSKQSQPELQWRPPLRLMDALARSADVLPLGSSPSPEPVTSPFYRIGRPRPGPVYTSRRTAASFPSCWTGKKDARRAVSGRSGMPIRPLVNSPGSSFVSLSDWVMECVRAAGGETRHAQQQQPVPVSGALRSLYRGANQWALRSARATAAGGGLNLSRWWTAQLMWPGQVREKVPFFSQEFIKTSSLPLHVCLLSLSLLLCYFLRPRVWLPCFIAHTLFRQHLHALSSRGCLEATECIRRALDIYVSAIHCFGQSSTIVIKQVCQALHIVKYSHTLVWL